MIEPKFEITCSSTYTITKNAPEPGINEWSNSGIGLVEEVAYLILHDDETQFDELRVLYRSLLEFGFPWEIILDFKDSYICTRTASPESLGGAVFLKRVDPGMLHRIFEWSQHSGALYVGAVFVWEGRYESLFTVQVDPRMIHVVPSVPASISNHWWQLRN